jgi:hypothetical protein
MGAAFVSRGGRVPARSVAVEGAASSTRPELKGIALALEESLPDEDLTIFTDSLVAMTNLFSLRSFRSIEILADSSSHML